VKLVRPLDAVGGRSAVDDIHRTQPPLHVIRLYRVLPCRASAARRYPVYSVSCDLSVALDTL
jgi:hypothetical protein